ncbi:MAG TPA: glycogen debranching N-terminal domain-containing protein [Nitrolancea sp.]|nr:glycogen debranching N-terminal domain-containing protein [Nitrolancea sp.]
MAEIEQQAKHEQRVEQQLENGTHRILQQGHPAVTVRVPDSMALKQGNMFLTCTQSGDILRGTDLGLYFHDMRYLSEQSLQIEEQQPVYLFAGLVSGGGGATYQLTNPDIHDKDGVALIRKDSIGIRRDKMLGNEYTETVTVENYRERRLDFSLRLCYDADFEDMFVVRGAQPGKRGTLHPPAWDGNALSQRYDGADGHMRQTTIHFIPAPDHIEGTHCTYHISLAPRETWHFQVVAELLDVNDGDLELTPTTFAAVNKEVLEHAEHGALNGGMSIVSDNPLFNNILTRSLLDLHVLAMRQFGQPFYAAGIPWFVALFGRDSLVTTIQMAAFQPRMAENTLRVLASHQGTKVDHYRDEEPGKILHELRVGEMANLGEVPQTPYYGTVDATILFLIVMGIYSNWVGNLELFGELRDNVERALSWIDKYGDSDGDGFIDYKTHSSKGLRNQGWKDSGNAIVMHDGTLAEPPIALPEVQGYAYLAWVMMADLYRRSGNAERADRLLRQAGDLRQRFNEHFWVSPIQYFAFCRQADGRYSHSIASNAAQALWTGIIADEHVADVVARVMQPDMFTGWGIRTLSANDRSYNPLDYQVGSVWPHDTALIAGGMYGSGHAEEAGRVFSALLHAAFRFEHFRLPETFCGYDRSYADQPVRYPVACSPQAWAAGAVPYLIQTALGLQPDGFNRRLRVVRPSLPDRLQWVTVRNVTLAECSVDLHFERVNDATLATVLRKEGDVTIAVEY